MMSSFFVIFFIVFNKIIAPNNIMLLYESHVYKNIVEKYTIVKFTYKIFIFATILLFYKNETQRSKSFKNLYNDIQYLI
jgi:hypothetical protein